VNQGSLYPAPHRLEQKGWLRAEWKQSETGCDAKFKPNANPVTVISYDFWKTQLGGAPDVVGRKLLVDRHPLMVIGVAASTFHGIDVGEVPSLCRRLTFSGVRFFATACKTACSPFSSRTDPLVFSIFRHAHMLSRACIAP
jgi:hypothetical protein